MEQKTIVEQLTKRPQYFKLEYVIRSSVKVLFDFLSTTQGLALWFADRVDERDKIYTFRWKDTTRKARLVGIKKYEFVRYRWLDDPESTSFEMRISIDEVTNDVALLISDYGFSAADVSDAKLLWNSNILTLKHQLGAF